MSLMLSKLAAENVEKKIKLNLFRVNLNIFEIEINTLEYQFLIIIILKQY